MRGVLLVIVLLGFGISGLPAAEGALPAAPAAGGANFQPYIFWAYGLACTLIFLFTLWTLAETRKVGEKLEYLKQRWTSAHPEAFGEQRRP